MRHLIIYFIVFFWLVALTVAIRNKEAPPKVQEIVIVYEKYDDFFRDQEANSVNMLVACEYFGVKYPSIVTAQAILESGNFKSDIFKEYNNPFGLYNSKKKDYFKFKHWTDAIVAYISMVEYKYRGGDYYKFLEGLPYAKDKKYIDKVKAIESNLPP